MRISPGVPAAILMLLVSACDQPDDGNRLNGEWMGTVTDRGQTVAISLVLRAQPSAVQGAFTILGKTGQDADQGKTVQIAQVEHSGTNLKFVVPLFGKLDDDAIAFDLQIEGNTLKGHAHEQRKGSSNIAVTLVRK